jgi:MFS superfamily sulfate permease-like transporter
MTSGVFMLIIIVAAGPAIELVPVAALAGILLAMVLHMFEFGTFKLIRYGRIIDVIVVIVVSVLGVVWDLAFAVLIGCGFTALAYAYQSTTLLRIDTIVPTEPLARPSNPSPSPDPSSAEAMPLLHPPSTRRAVIFTHDLANSPSPALVDPPLAPPTPSRSSSAHAFAATDSMSTSKLENASTQETLPLVGAPQVIHIAAADSVVIPSDVHAALAVASSPQKIYVLSGPLSFCNVSDFSVAFDAATDPQHICIDFTRCRVMDHSALWGVRDVLLLYTAAKKIVSAIGFAASAENAGDWQILLAPAQFAADRHMSHSTATATVLLSASVVDGSTESSAIGGSMVRIHADDETDAAVELKAIV